MHCRRHEVDWEHAKIGLGATPFRTDAGWLMIYHAVDKDRRYTLGLALLDPDDPTVTLKRCLSLIGGRSTLTWIVFGLCLRRRLNSW